MPVPQSPRTQFGCLPVNSNVFFGCLWELAMLKRINLLAIVFILAWFPVAGQTAAPAPPATIWNTLSAPSMDPSKFARAENVSIVRDAGISRLLMELSSSRIP
jgi:hypothetical protein